MQSATPQRTSVSLSMSPAQWATWDPTLTNIDGPDPHLRWTGDAMFAVTKQDMFGFWTLKVEGLGIKSSHLHTALCVDYEHERLPHLFPCRLTLCFMALSRCSTISLWPSRWHHLSPSLALDPAISQVLCGLPPLALSFHTPFRLTFRLPLGFASPCRFPLHFLFPASLVHSSLPLSLF